MPRLNDIWIKGIVCEPPSEKKDKKTGEVLQVALCVITVHGKRSYGERIAIGSDDARDIVGKQFERVWLRSDNVDIIKQMRECTIYDFVECKGVLRVDFMKKASYCLSCGAQNIYEGYKTTVYPIYFERTQAYLDEFGITESDLTDELEQKIKQTALTNLQKAYEASNCARLMGVICKQPELYLINSENEMNKCVLTFPMAVMRKYRIPGRNMTAKADFPYIKLYNTLARNASKVLSQKNLVYVDGFLRNRLISRNRTCGECGEKYSTQDEVMELIAYSIEYIREDVSDPARFTAKDSADMAENAPAASSFNPQTIGSEADIELGKNVEDLKNTDLTDIECAELGSDIEDTDTENT